MCDARQRAPLAGRGGETRRRGGQRCCHLGGGGRVGDPRFERLDEIVDLEGWADLHAGQADDLLLGQLQ